MKFNDARYKKITYFDDVDHGTFFLYEDELYIKLNDIEAFMIGEEVPVAFNCNDKIEPVKVEICIVG